MTRHIAYVGIGSNLDAPINQVLTAINELESHSEISLIKVSGVYASKPMGPQDQPDYINAAVKVETQMAPLDLLKQLQELEQKHQRVRLERWGPRTLDLDILMFDQLTSDDPTLTLPHPGAHQRSFVLLPLRDIEPELAIKNNSLEHWLNITGQEGIRRLTAAELQQV